MKTYTEGKDLVMVEGENVWYHLDPDNNKKEPENGLFCCRCKRPIRQTMSFENFISVEINPVHYWVIRPNSHLTGKHLLGSECAKKLHPVDINIVNKIG